MKIHPLLFVFIMAIVLPQAGGLAAILCLEIMPVDQAMVAGPMVAVPLCLAASLWLVLPSGKDRKAGRPPRRAAGKGEKKLRGLAHETGDLLLTLAMMDGIEKKKR